MPDASAPQFGARVTSGGWIADCARCLPAVRAIKGAARGAERGGAARRALPQPSGAPRRFLIWGCASDCKRVLRQVALLVTGKSLNILRILYLSGKS